VLSEDAEAELGDIALLGVLRNHASQSVVDGRAHPNEVLGVLAIEGGGGDETRTVEHRGGLVASRGVTSGLNEQLRRLRIGDGVVLRRDVVVAGGAGLLGCFAHDSFLFLELPFIWALFGKPTSVSALI